MTGGLVLTIGGIWVLSQVLVGNALGRLGIAGEATKPGTGGTATGKGNQKELDSPVWTLPKIGG